MLSATGVVLLAAAAPAPTPPPKAAPRAITQPNWLEKPNGVELSHAYPHFADQFYIEGSATIRCAVDTTGALTDCKVDHEAPKGVGFGDGALELAGAFRMTPQTVNGEPTANGEVRIPIAFRLPKPPPPPDLGIRPPTSPEALVEARRFIEAGQQTANFEASYATHIREWELLDRPDDAGGKLSSATAEAMKAALAAELPALKEDLARYYAGAFPASVLKAQIGFNQSPLGRKMLARLDDIRAMNEMVGRAWQSRAKSGARDAFCAAHACDATADVAAFMADAHSDHPTVQIPIPQWANVPTPEEISQARPELAKWMDMGGYVRLICKATAQGWMGECQVAHEAPLDLGLGRAALVVARSYRLAPSLVAQGAAGQTVSVIIQFPGGGGDETAADAPPPRSAAALALAKDVQAAGDVAKAQDDQWKRGMDNMLAHAPQGATTTEVASVADAMTKGRDKAIQITRDLNALYMTQLYTDEELKVLAAHLRSPAGRAWSDKAGETTADTNLIYTVHDQAILRDAGRRICATLGDCPYAAQASNASSAPASTRTP